MTNINTPAIALQALPLTVEKSEILTDASSSLQCSQSGSKFIFANEIPQTEPWDVDLHQQECAGLWEGRALPSREQEV